VKTVLVATAFLTRVPVPVAASAADVGAAAQWFPVVGAALGGAAAAIAWVMTDVLGVPSMLAAALLVGLGAWVTGGLHLDGLADMADGFGGGRTREDVLRIMREPAIGSYGATAVAIVIAIKVTAVAALLDRDGSLPFLVAAPVISRWSISPLAAYLPYARAAGGLGQAVTRDGHTARLLVATAITAVIVTAAARLDGLAAWAGAGLMAAYVARLAWRRIGGVTGDVLGAGVELTESTALVCGVLLTAT
jgi:cobalamin 5'-phosphate synthase/cobalamin synthase